MKAGKLQRVEATAQNSGQLICWQCAADDAFLRHISGETNTQLVLRGRGSGMIETPEPLHILITGSQQKGIDEATRQAILPMPHSLT